jgi:hypothetical protein
MIKYLAFVVAVVLLVAAIWRLRIPYSVQDFKHLKANALRREITSWRISHEPENYGYTNEHERCYLASRGVLVGTNTLSCVMVLESSVFQQKGFLLGTREGVVVWFDGKAAEPLK